MPMTESNKKKTLSKIDILLTSSMTRSELKWLRKQMESEDAEIKQKAIYVHDTKFFFLRDYSGIRDAQLTELSLYIQGDSTDEPMFNEMFRHVQYVLRYGGYMIKTVYGGDEEYVSTDERHSVRRKSPKTITSFFEKFLDKLDEMYAAEVYIPGATEPGIPGYLRKTPAFSRWDNDEDDDKYVWQPPEPIFGDPKKSTARWSLQLNFDNGAQRVSIHDGDGIGEAGLMLGIIDDYFDRGSVERLKFKRSWIEKSDDDVKKWENLF